jgi:hypothetical protein
MKIAIEHMYRDILVVQIWRLLICRSGITIKISNRRATQRCNVSAFFHAKICSLLARRRSSQPVQRVYWPENIIDWLGKWRPTCVMWHARGQIFILWRDRENQYFYGQQCFMCWWSNDSVLYHRFPDKNTGILHQLYIHHYIQYT